MTKLNKLPVEGGVIVDATTRLNQNFSSLLGVTINNGIRQAIDRSSVFSGDGDDVFVEAYTSAGGRNETVDGDATLLEFDTNKYKYPETLGYYVIVNGSINDINSLKVNGCRIFRLGDESVLIYHLDSDYEIQRSSIISSLFFGDNPLIKTAFNTVSGIEVSDSEDVGKRFVYVDIRRQSSSDFSVRTYTGDFVNTSDNTNIRSWTITSSTGGTTQDRRFTDNSDWVGDNYVDCRVEVQSGSNVGSRVARWRIPSGTIRVQTTNGESSGTVLSRVRALIMTNGGLTWTNDSTSVDANIDFFADEGIPLLSEVSVGLEDYFYSTHDLPVEFQKPIISSISSVLFEDFEEGVGVQYKFLDSSDNETAWLNINEISVFSSITPDRVRVKLNQTNTSPTPGFPSIRGFGFLGGN